MLKNKETKEIKGEAKTNLHAGKQEIKGELQNSIQEWRDEALIIQASFDFTVPNYILDEIIGQNDSSNGDNLNCLINCAVINNKISHEQANKIKRQFIKS